MENFGQGNIYIYICIFTVSLNYGNSLSHLAIHFDLKGQSGCNACTPMELLIILHPSKLLMRSLLNLNLKTTA